MARDGNGHVVISGGGPTGVVAALACAQRGFRFDRGDARGALGVAGVGQLLA
jgi:NADPH-dependent 2,4-dienoyl-CoA reductase/sulfur reductase-like enzyme